MTPKQRTAHVQAITACIQSHGYKEDMHGNFVKEFPKTDLNDAFKQRYVLSMTSLRKEKQINHGDGTKSWIRLRSAYLRDITVVDNQIVGLRRDGCQPAVHRSVLPPPATPPLAQKFIAPSL
jgi:hypothetical protein